MERLGRNKAARKSQALVGWQVIDNGTAVPIFAAPRGKTYNCHGTLAVYLQFICPSCGHKLSHCGGFVKDKPGNADGHRASHCSCWPHGYYVLEIIK